VRHIFSAKMLLYGHDRELALWAGLKLGYQGPIGNQHQPVAIGVARNGAIVAAAVFYDYRITSIEVTFVTTSSRWASRENIRAILNYPFVQLKCKRLTAITEEGNASARAFLERIGFRQEGIHPDGFESGAGVSYGMLRDDAKRWL
jgi:RimJ/RimL family protein N-acetyltransferase